jgi:hypothetical protein
MRAGNTSECVSEVSGSKHEPVPEERENSGQFLESLMSLHTVSSNVLAYQLDVLPPIHSKGRVDHLLSF